MSFKLYDLKPVESKKRVFAQEKKESKQSAKPMILKIIGGLVLVVIVLIVAARFMHAKLTRIDIWPQTKPMDSEITLNAKKDLAEIDFANQIAPAKEFKKEVIISKGFAASQSDSAEKAHGTIKVTSKYNKSVSLIANTRFLSSSSPTRMFLAKKKFTVPANGSINVEVIASETGSDFNIDPCTFSIPGLRNFDPPTLYSDITGKSLAKMQGGSSSSVKKISQSDIDKAEAELKLEVEDRALQELKGLAGEEYALIDKTIETDITESSPVDAQVGQIKDTFIYQLKVNASVLGIKKSDLISLISKYLEAQQFADLDIKEGSIQIKTIEPIIDAQQNIALNIDFSIEVYPPIDLVSLKEVVKGQSPSNIKRYIMEVYPEMKTEPSVKLSPFFTGKGSVLTEQIEINVKFE